MLISILLIAVAVSTDAFSLALIYGTIRVNQHQSILLSLTTGIFHFFLPLLGSLLGNNLIAMFHIEMKFVIAFILFIVGISMIKSKNETDCLPISLYFSEMILFALAVSFDSLFVGTGLDALNYNKLFISLIFLLLVLYLPCVVLVWVGRLKKDQQDCNFYWWDYFDTIRFVLVFLKLFNFIIMAVINVIKT